MPTLTWLTRKEDIKVSGQVPYRILESVEKGVYGDSNSGNLLIQGDNLDALKSLLPFYAGCVKCIFIDPPYNTGNAFTHYDDNLEHSQWLEIMYPRIELLRNLLAGDGAVWVTLDHHQIHYLKVIMDEIFGRKNFISHFIWEKKRKASFLSKQVGNIVDHILCFAKDKSLCAPFTYGMVSKDETYPLYNSGNKKSVLVFPPRTVKFLRHKDGGYEIQEYAEKTSVVKLISPLKIVDGWNANNLMIEGEWRYSQETVTEQLGDGDHYVVKSEKFRPRRMLTGNVKAKKVHNLLSKSHYNMATNEDAASELLELLPNQEKFDYPKPEGLIQFIIDASTQPGDLVLDSFLGSGTTAAVAHKMNRRWIGIEMGEHAHTHCIPRLEKVIAGEQGGISKAVNWQGGGGFRFFRLGEEIFSPDGGINQQITFPVLAAHLWFAETHTPYNGKASPFLGVHDGIGYALLYNGILQDKKVNGGNILTTATLASIRSAAPKKFTGKIIVYANGCRFGEARIQAENLAFKQLPYDFAKR